MKDVVTGVLMFVAGLGIAFSAVLLLSHLKNKDKHGMQIGSLALVMYVVLFLCIKPMTDFMFQGYQDPDKVEKITYGEFMQLVEDGKVDTVFYSTSNEWMTVTLYNEDTIGMPVEEREEYNYKNSDKREVQYPAYDEFRKDMLDAGVNLVLKDSNAAIILQLIGNFIPLALMLAMFYMIYKRQFNVGELKLNSTTEDKRFSDVIGMDEVIEDVRFIVDLLKDPNKGKEIGVKPPKGILLSGPPGTGKTLLSKAIAGEAGVPFLYMNASSFVEIYVGVGAKRVRDLFKEAREKAPCIIFIDEIDSVGERRGTFGGNSESDQTINALLQEMDGFNGRDGIFVLAATNRPDKLDKALTRAGRFDREIHIGLPRDWTVRKKIFDYYLRGMRLGDDVNVESLSRQTSGFSGADIKAVCNEAGMVAMSHDKGFVSHADFEEAIDKHVFKGSRSKRQDENNNDKKIVAYHEAGHAVMSYLCNVPISRASIQASTSGVGGAVFNAESNSVFMTGKEFLSHIKICYAGRASEELFFQDVTTGAENDITQATTMIDSYIQKYGFDKDFGMLDMEVITDKKLIEFSEIFERMQNLSKELYNEVVLDLRSHKEMVRVLAEALLDAESMSGEEVESLLHTHDGNMASLRG